MPRKGMPLIFVRVETNSGGNRKVVEEISSTAVIVQDLCLNEFRARQVKYVVDLLPYVEAVIGSRLHIGMHPAEGIDQRNRNRV